MKNKNKKIVFGILSLLIVYLFISIFNESVIAETTTNTIGGLAVEVNDPVASLELIFPSNSAIITENIFRAKVRLINCTKVDFFLSRLGQDFVKVGTSESPSSDNIFIGDIDASSFENGEYTFLAKAICGSLSKTSYSAIKINRTVNSTDETTASTSTLATKTIPQEDVRINITNLPNNTTIRSGTFGLVIFSPEATKVELKIRKNGASNFEYYGSFLKNTDGFWRITIDSSKRLPNGKYNYLVEAKIGDNIYKSEERVLNIDYDDKILESKVNQLETTKKINNETINKRNNDIYDYSLREDPDGDGLSNEREIFLGTNPNSQDTDKDGIPDGEEIRLKTDPKNPDTDRDGFLDGDEVRNGFDPLKSSIGEGGDKIIFENPREVGEIKDDYLIEKVEVIKKDSAKNRLVISGKGLPNSFITLYIYSEPIVVTIKTDMEGNWTYELDKEFEDGEHESYVTVTDNTGKITGKSQPVRFVKTAEAATIIPSAQAQAISKNQSPTQNSRNNFIFYGIILVIIFMGISLAVVGIIGHKHNYE